MNISSVFLGTSHGDPSLTRFCSSTLYRFGDVSFLIDAAAPVTSSLLRHDKESIQGLDAVFLTHMHMDHTGGLPDLARYLLKNTDSFKETPFFFPEKEAIPVFRQWLRACHVTGDVESLCLKHYRDGLVWRKGAVSVSCIPTAHIEDGRFPSYAFLMETGGFRILHTGDLAADFHDFPLRPSDPACDVCVCEATHIAGDLDAFLERLHVAPIRKLVFNHIGPLWTDGKEPELRRITESLPYPVVIAADGMELAFQDQDAVDRP